MKTLKKRSEAQPRVSHYQVAQLSKDCAHFAQTLKQLCQTIDQRISLGDEVMQLRWDLFRQQIESELRRLDVALGILLRDKERSVDSHAVLHLIIVRNKLRTVTRQVNEEFSMLGV